MENPKKKCWLDAVIGPHTEDQHQRHVNDYYRDMSSRGFVPVPETVQRLEALDYSHQVQTCQSVFLPLYLD